MSRYSRYLWINQNIVPNKKYAVTKYAFHVMDFLNKTVFDYKLLNNNNKSNTDDIHNTGIQKSYNSFQNITIIETI